MGNRESVSGGHSTGSWDLDVSLAIIKASLAEFDGIRREPTVSEPRPLVKRYVLHGSSPATQTSHGATWHGHPMTESAANYVLREKELRGGDTKYWLEPVTVEEPVERSVIHWQSKDETERGGQGHLPPMSSTAAEYYLHDIPEDRRARTNFRIEQLQG